VEGAVVKGKLLAQARGKKLIVFKAKSKKRERTKNGHRQSYSEVEITSIEGK
jgi:large subunit ribosomal protein L21